MESIKNVFLFQIFLIATFSQILSACQQEQTFIRQHAQVRMWHPLLCAIQQANNKEVKKIMMTIDKNDRMLTGFITPLAIAQTNAQDKRFHPATRQKYYEMCQTLQDFEVTSTYPAQPMPSSDIMLQEYREYHKETIAIRQYLNENKKVGGPVIKKYHNKHYKN